MLWLSGWFYRKNHIINPAAGAGAGYQVRVTVHYGAGVDFGEDVYCNSLCRTDFGDIRFTDDNDNLLDYWMQSKTDGVSAVFWVEVAASLESASQTVYVYYGKSDASTTSNQANTFVDVVSGVVGAWNLEEANALDPVLDYSGNGNNGVATGTTIVAGKFAGKNMRQFSDGNYITVPNSDPRYDLSGGLFTIISLMKKSGNPPDNFAPIVNRFSGGFFKGYVMWVYNATGYPKFQFGDGVSGINIVPSINVCDGNYHWLIATGDAPNKTATLYIDNNATNSSGPNPLLNHSANVSIGGVGTNYSLAPDGLGYIVIIKGVKISSTTVANINANYPDVSLEAGKVLVRKWASSTQPSHDVWGSVERLVVASDSFSAGDGVLRDRLLGVSDSVGAADALLGSKGLLLSDSLGAVDVAAVLKTLLVSDAVGLADVFLALKGLGVADSFMLLDSVSVPLRVRTVLDSACLADGLLVDKALMVADRVFVVETVEVGTGDRRTRLFLILGNIAVQLTKPA